MNSLQIELKDRFTNEVLFTYNAKPGEERCSEKELRVKAVVAATRLGIGLPNASLCGLVFPEDTNLTYFPAPGADLSGCVFRNVNLRNANLHRAILDGCEFEGANLDGVDLSRSSLVGAYLDGVNFGNVAFDHVAFGENPDIIQVGYPNGWNMVAYLKGGYLAIRCGCRDKRLAEAKAYWDGKVDRQEICAGLVYIETVAKLRGWALEAPVPEEQGPISAPTQIQPTAAGEEPEVDDDDDGYDDEGADDED